MEPGRLAVVLLVAGLVLVVGSCVPVVGSLYRFATLAPELTWTVPPATGRGHAEVRVPARKRLAAGLRWSDGGASSHRIPDSVAFELDITRAGGEALQRLRGQWPESPGTMTAEPESGSDRYHRTARWLPPFTVAHDTVVFIDLAVDPMELAAGGAPGLELLLFREVPEFTVSFFSALVLWVLGILTVLIGAIWWLRHVAGNVLSPAGRSGRGLDGEARSLGLR
jgi:hypothetical protein